MQIDLRWIYRTRNKFICCTGGLKNVGLVKYNKGFHILVVAGILPHQAGA